MENKYICQGATLFCSEGDKKSQLGILPMRNVYIENKPMANIMDYKPIVNIRPFGKCRSLANPSVKAATAAHHGLLTPMPCIPNTLTPWINGKNDVDIMSQNGVLETSCLECAWKGVIKVVHHGQMGPGLVVTNAEGVEKTLYTCEIPRVQLVYKKGHKEKTVVLYNKDEKEKAVERKANIMNDEEVMALRNELAIIDRSPEKRTIDYSIIANECYGDAPKYIGKTNYVKVEPRKIKPGHKMYELSKAIHQANLSESSTGFHAELFYNEMTGEYTLGFAGSGMQLADWIGNGLQATGNEFSQQKLSNEIIKAINKLPKDQSLSIVGHSLGGALASYVGLATGRPTYTYNAEGVSDKILAANGLLEKKNNRDYQITAYYNEADILSRSQDAIDSSNYAASAIGDRVSLGNLNTKKDTIIGAVGDALISGIPVLNVIGATAGIVSKSSVTGGLLGHMMPRIVDYNLSEYDGIQEKWQINKDKLNNKIYNGNGQ